MKTQELRSTVAKVMREKGHDKITKETVKDFIEVLEEVIDGVIAEGNDITLMGVKFGSKEQKGREGIIGFGAKQGETYKTEDKIIPTVKFLPAKKAQLTKAK